ncbi:MAG: guanylate kinase [Gammaproteobacteria bacterium]
MNTGKLFIVSAPSGAGKTSLVRRLTSEMDNIAVSISHTTRPQRPGEVNGSDYFFVTAAEFEAMMKNREFIECARVFDNYYGTARKTVEEMLAKGRDIILEIDWQGAQQIRSALPESLSIFILPPSKQALEERLRSRGQDSEETIARRMKDAEMEISHYSEYDFLIVNDEFDKAVEQLKSVIAGGCLKNRENIDGLLRELLA